MSRSRATATEATPDTEATPEADATEVPPPDGATEATPETAAVPGWNAPPPRLQDAPDDRATTAGDVGDGGPAQSSGEASSPASTDVLAARRGRVKLAGQLIGAVLAAAGGLLNARAREHEEDDIWLMTKDEMDGIATPLGRVAARRVPLPDGGTDASDLADLVNAGVGALAYAIRNLQESATRRRAAAATPTYGDTGDQGDQGDAGDAGEATPHVAPPVTSPVESIAVNGSGVWGSM